MVGNGSRLILGRYAIVSQAGGFRSVRALLEALPGTTESRLAALIGAVVNAIAFAYLLESSPGCVLRLVMPLG